MHGRLKRTNTLCASICFVSLALVGSTNCLARGASDTVTEGGRAKVTVEFRPKVASLATLTIEELNYHTEVKNAGRAKINVVESVDSDYTNLVTLTVND